MNHNNKRKKGDFLYTQVTEKDYFVNGGIFNTGKLVDLLKY